MKTNKLLSVVAAATIVATATAIPSASAANTDPLQRMYQLSDYEAGQPLVSTENLRGIMDQPTLRGRDISTLKYNQGRVYVGYGDYTDNTGPIDLYSYDGNTGESKFEIKVPTESIESLPEINGKLYAPYTDPKAPWTSPVGFASNRDGAWTLTDSVPMIHNYDMASTNGTNLFMAGSIQEGGKFYATIWYSADGRTNWQIIKKVASPTARGEFDRYYWLETENGKLYAMADLNGATTLDTWENGSWTSTPLSVNDTQGLNVSKPDEISIINGHLVTINPKFDNGSKVQSTVYSIAENRTLSGAEVTRERRDASFPVNEEDNSESLIFTDFERHGDTLFGLSGGHVFFTKDGRNWSYLLSVDTATKFTLAPDQKRIYFSNSANGTPHIFYRSVPEIRNKIPDIQLPSNAPVIRVGQTWDPLAGVTASDPEDGDLTPQIQSALWDGEMDFSKPGQFSYAYGVNDSKQASATYIILVTVTDSAVPPSSGSRAAFCMRASDPSGHMGQAGGLGCTIAG